MYQVPKPKQKIVDITTDEQVAKLEHGAELEVVLINYYPKEELSSSKKKFNY